MYLGSFPTTDQQIARWSNDTITKKVCWNLIFNFLRNTYFEIVQARQASKIQSTFSFT